MVKWERRSASNQSRGGGGRVRKAFDALVNPSLVTYRAHPKYREGDPKQTTPSTLFKAEYTDDDIDEVLVRDEVANKLVRKLARDCIGRGFTIDAKQTVKEAIEEQMEVLEVKRVLYRALVHMLGRGRCALMLGTDKDKSIEMERDLKADITYLHATHPRFIKRIVIETDPTKPRYGDVAAIEVDRVVNSAPSRVTIPRSRYIWMANVVTDDNPEGTSILYPVMDQFTVKKNLDWSVGESYYKNASPLHQLELPEDADADEFDEAEKEFKDISARTEFVTPEGYKIYLHGTQNVMSPAPYVQHNLKCISAGLDVPYQILLGTAAGAVTGAEMNLKDYYQSIAMIQQILVEPYVREVVDALQETGQIPEGTYKLQWLPLEEMGEKERAEIAKMRAEALNIAMSAVPAALKYGLKCRIVDGVLRVEDADIKEPEPEEVPEGEPATPPGQPPAPGEPTPPGEVPEPPSLPPTQGGDPLGSPSVDAGPEVQEYMQWLRLMGYRDPPEELDDDDGMELFLLLQENNFKNVTRQERAELAEKWVPDAGHLERKAISDATTGLYEMLDDFFVWLNAEVQKALEDAGLDSLRPYRNEVAWKTVYEEANIEGKVIGRKMSNMAAKAVADEALDQSYLYGYEFGGTALGAEMAVGYDPLDAQYARMWLQNHKVLFQQRLDDGSNVRQVKQRVVDGIRKGWGMPKIQASVAEVSKAAEQNIERAVRSIVQEAAVEGNLSHWKELGVTKVTFLATPDEVTCVECMAMDGREFTIEASSGVIPVHDLCRCGFVPDEETMVTP